MRSEEIPLLDDFLHEVISIPEGMATPPRSIIENENHILKAFTLFLPFIFYSHENERYLTIFARQEKNIH